MFMGPLCLVLHHRNEKIPTKMTADEIIAITQLADKCDCSRALRLAAGFWFDGHIKTTYPNADAKLLSTAYKLKHPKLIQAWGVELVLHATYSVDTLVPYDRSLPSTLLGKFHLSSLLPL